MKWRPFYVVVSFLFVFLMLSSAFSSLAAQTSKLEKPRDVLAAPSNQAIELSWSAPKGEGPVAYNVYVDGTFHKKVTERTITIKQLKNGNEYSFAVSALDAAGNESDKATVSESPKNVLPILLLIFLCIAYIYNKVFRVEQLTIRQSITKHFRAIRNRQFSVAGKSLLIYGLILCGSYMLLFFQLMGLPILISLAIAIGLMLIVRIRYWIQGRQNDAGESQ